MMTAAMAFFSIALTLNLAGVRLTDLRLADLTPASLENNLTRQFYGAKSQMVRYYDNLRFVYEVESKMRELRRDEDTQRPATTQPSAQPKQETPAPQGTQPTGGSPGNRHKNGGKLESAPGVPQPDVIFGQKDAGQRKVVQRDRIRQDGNLQNGGILPGRRRGPE